MSAKIINGKKIAEELQNLLKKDVAALPSAIGLAIVQIGDDEASTIYVRNKLKAAAAVGINAVLHKFSEDVSQTKVSSLITKLNADPDVNGIIIQLPLPAHLDEETLLESIKPEKDVDGFHPLNIGRLQNGSDKALIAATPKGILYLLENCGIDLCGGNALIIGCSKIVGRPAGMLLLQKGCTVTLAHIHTKNLPELIKNADIIIAACGCPQTVKAEWVKQGAVLIDVGINRLNSKLGGDIEPAAIQKASFITPVPGGVGPMTVAMLLHNTYEAYLKQKQEKPTK